ncbi:MAG: SDR family oxidoreductase [Chloroflexi bacterium]|nr:SDR family oxidoreductase [Chloroflexota bacterium]
MELTDKVALITGAGVRIGRALALALAQRGAHVLVHYHTSEGEAQEVVERIRQMGRRALAVRADLRDAARAGQLVERGVEALGGVDVLINSAAIFRRGTLAETDERLWDDHFAINLKAPFFLCQAFARQIGDRRGHIINIADWRAVQPGTAYVAYYLTKAALVTMTQSLAQALGPNVQVNAIAPGAILPPPGDDGSYFQRLARQVPLKRTGSLEEVVKAALYLLDADFVTGELLFVDGGEHL